MRGLKISEMCRYLFACHWCEQKKNNSPTAGVKLNCNNNNTTSKLANFIGIKTLTHVIIVNSEDLLMQHYTYFWIGITNNNV